MIRIRNVWKKYSKSQVFHRSLREDILNIFKSNNDSEIRENEFWALQNITFDVKNGECVGLYGPNGSGKTTILKIIANVTYPTKGSVLTDGKVVPLLQKGAGFHMDLTGRENIYVNAAILGMSIWEIRKRIPEIIEFSEIGEFIDLPVKKYSSGMRVRLGFSVAIHSEADIFLMDEILAVGDESFREKCMAKIKDLKEQNKTMIIVTHNFRQMQVVADRILFIDKGRINIK